MYLLVPQVFFGVLFGLFIISILIVFSFNRQEKRSSVELSGKELLLKKEIAAKNELEKKLKGELSLSKQMYDGLKGQYDELENSIERLAQESEEKKIPEQKIQAQELTPRPEIKEDLHPRIEISLQDLNYPARAGRKQSETPPDTINSGPDIGLKSS